MSPETPIVFAEHPVHRLMGTVPMDPRPDAARPPVLFLPSEAGMKCLKAADVILAVDVMDREKVRLLKCPPADAPDPPAGAPAVGVKVLLDFDDGDELPWLTAAVAFAAAGVSPERQAMQNVKRPQPTRRKKK